MFGIFLDLQFLHFFSNIVHNILLREIVVDQKMWFLVEDRCLQFFAIEFGLIMGLRFGDFPKVGRGSNRLRD